VRPDEGKSNKKSKSKKAPSKKSISEGLDGVADDSDQAERKPRIRISLAENIAGETDDQPKKGKKKRAKRKQTSATAGEDDGANGAVVDASPVPTKKQKKNHGQSKKKGSKGAASAVLHSRETDESKTVATETSVVEPTPQSDESDMFDLTALKKQRDLLDGSFEAARSHLTDNGPWKLPDGLEDKFADIALATLSKMDR
jgi:hypothetical protein